MKKTLLFISFISFSLLGFSQTLSIDTGGVNIENDTLYFEFTDVDDYGCFSGDYHVNITNTGSSDLEIQVKRTPKSIECGKYKQPIGHTMCLGDQCYTGDIIPGATNTKKIEAGQTLDLHIKLQFDSVGITNEFYEVYEYNNEANNLVSFSAHYVGGNCTAGYNNITNIFSVKSYPNPANNRINFDYNINKKSYITIHDITGKKVGSIELNTNLNSATFNTEDLQSGIYFYNVHIDGFRTKTDKFIVRH